MTKASNNKITIGIVLSSIPKYSETFFRNKIKGLQESGFNVILFVEYANNSDLDYKCKVVVAPLVKKSRVSSIFTSSMIFIKGLVLRPKKCLKLFLLNKKDNLSTLQNVKNIILNQFILKEDLDWLHFGYGMLAINRENIAAAMNAKMALSFRGADLYLTPLKHSGCYDRLWKKAIKYHVLSEEMQQTLIENYKINDAEIKVITPAINTEQFRCEASSNRDNKTLKMVTVARLHWKKGLEYTLEALALLKQQDIKFHYTIIGEGDDYERLIFAAHQLKINDNVEFTGKLNQGKVKNHLQNADIYLQYSIQEGFCNALLEAQAMRLLCIASDAEGLQENIINEQTGWIVPKRNPKQFSSKIIEVNNLSTSKKEIIKQKAMLRVKQNFNLEMQKKRFVNFYSH
ncbi:glycosyltransferase family 4 protein [Ichthyenterobacterium sp. W332]|uniref:Glycosyltransferase family 4 protein n=1 Tax=Microcosmobacter mediterraneus TaxID=3075607 RepID=A0ABU2YHR8_9FLAO|nr:glycosyltransferase family 4 protein [Ichthyenterobacterium sp. W332]MDT0557357.1 glycosyltransferase family 4 protein [Ichthyenterobacterium sp. W332]